MREQTYMFQPVPVWANEPHHEKGPRGSINQPWRICRPFA